ncbi:MAG: class I SAM-dependent methyltransferase [Salinibacter sp.]
MVQRRSILFLLMIGLFGVAALPGAAGAQVPEAPSSDTVEKVAPYVATPDRVVRRMLEAADVTSDDVVYDLGSGDGRIPILAAKEFGARGIGIEIDSELVEEARANAEAAGVADQVEFREMDLFDTDLSDATVVALYLWPEINVKLRPKLLQELDPGDRVVSHDFRIGKWEPDQSIEMGSDPMTQELIFTWTIPETVPDRLLRTPDTTDAPGLEQ